MSLDEVLLIQIINILIYRKKDFLNQEHCNFDKIYFKSIIRTEGIFR